MIDRALRCDARRKDFLLFCFIMNINYTILERKKMFFEHLRTTQNRNTTRTGDCKFQLLLLCNNTVTKNENIAPQVQTLFSISRIIIMDCITSNK